MEITCAPLPQVQHNIPLLPIPGSHRELCGNHHAVNYHPQKSSPIVILEGDNWVVINQETGNIILQSGIMNSAMCPGTSKAQEYHNPMKGPYKLKFITGTSNKIVRLLQVIGNMKGTITCFLIHRNKFPQGDKVTHCHIVCDIRPWKKDIHQVHITVGGYRLTFNGPVSTTAYNITTSKTQM